MLTFREVLEALRLGEKGAPQALADLALADYSGQRGDCGGAPGDSRVRVLAVLEDLVGAAADAVGPVVENQHPVVVVAAGFCGVVDDQGRVEATVDLDAAVRTIAGSARSMGVTVEGV